MPFCIAILFQYQKLAKQEKGGTIEFEFNNFAYQNERIRNILWFGFLGICSFHNELDWNGL